jgi:hypothetical protein
VAPHWNFVPTWQWQKNKRATAKHIYEWIAAKLVMSIATSSFVYRRLVNHPGRFWIWVDMGRNLMEDQSGIKPIPVTLNFSTEVECPTVS